MNRQKREALRGDSQPEAGRRADTPQRGGTMSPPREQVKGISSTEQSQPKSGADRESGRMPLPD
jgi:hypothetical protein